MCVGTENTVCDCQYLLHSGDEGGASWSSFSSALPERTCRLEYTEQPRESGSRYRISTPPSAFIPVRGLGDAQEQEPSRRIRRLDFARTSGYASAEYVNGTGPPLGLYAIANEVLSVITFARSLPRGMKDTNPVGYKKTAMSGGVASRRFRRPNESMVPYPHGRRVSM